MVEPMEILLSKVHDVAFFSIEKHSPLAQSIKKITELRDIFSMM